MVVTQREMLDFKRELNVILEQLDERLKKLEEVGKAKPATKTTAKKEVDNAA